MKPKSSFDWLAAAAIAAIVGLAGWFVFYVLNHGPALSLGG